MGRRLTEGWSSGDREKAIRTAWEVNVSPSFAAGEERYATFRENALGARVALEVIMLQIQAVGGHDVARAAGARSTSRRSSSTASSTRCCPSPTGG